MKKGRKRKGKPSAAQRLHRREAKVARQRKPRRKSGGEGGYTRGWNPLA